MAVVIVETLSDTPLKPEIPTDSDYRVQDCLTERGAAWQYSLLSSDRHRMLCTFNAPNAESVRESFRRGGGRFNHIWTGTAVKPEGQPQRNLSMFKVFELTHPNGLTHEQWYDTHQRILTYCAQQNPEWVLSYVSRSYTHAICELNTSDTESVEDAYRQMGVSCDRTWSALLITPYEINLSPQG